MRDLYWFMDTQMARLSLYFPKSSHRNLLAIINES